MDAQPLQRRADRARARRRRQRQRRLRALAALGSLAVAAVAVAVIVLTSGSGSRPGTRASASARPRATGHDSRIPARHDPVATAVSAHLGPATGRPGDARVPVLMYHVINPPPAGAPYPGLYVPRTEFAAQMQALAHAGWHAVTLDELRENWMHGDRLPANPIVITFDNGYESQYTNALPILHRLHWAAVENIQLTGLPPSQGGMTTAQVEGLIHGGWELDTQGISHADLPALDATELSYQIDHARSVLRARYHQPVDWFCYPSGQYDATVVAAVRRAGFVGSTTVVPGWASREDSAFALPRLRVLGGTTPGELLAQITSAQGAGPTPPSDTSSTP